MTPDTRYEILISAFIFSHTHEEFFGALIILVIGMAMWLILRKPDNGGISSSPLSAVRSPVSVAKIANMKFTSSAFEHGGLIPVKYTCDGENISPPLEISEVPQEAKSLVLIMEDPDVPWSIRSDGMWDHWLIWDIPADIAQIGEATTPPAIVGENTAGRSGYQGPCPPDREHRYFFKIFALDTLLELDPARTTKQDLLIALKDHVLGQAELLGRYQRIVK